MVDIPVMREADPGDGRVHAVVVVETEQFVSGQAVTMLEEARQHGAHPGAATIGRRDNDVVRRLDFLIFLAAPQPVIEGEFLLAGQEKQQ